MYFSLSKKSSPSYRADIDGLRGIAVLWCSLFTLERQSAPEGSSASTYFRDFGLSDWFDHPFRDCRFEIFSSVVLRAPGSKNRPALFVNDAGHLAASLQILSARGTGGISQNRFLASTFSISNVYFFPSIGLFEGPAAMKPLSTHLVARCRGAVLYFPSAIPHRGAPILPGQAACPDSFCCDGVFLRECMGCVSQSLCNILFGAYQSLELLLGH